MFHFQKSAMKTLKIKSGYSFGTKLQRDFFYNASLSSEDKEIAKQSGEIPKVTKEIGDGINLEYLILKILVAWSYSF